MPEPTDEKFPAITEKMMIATQWNLMVERAKFLAALRGAVSLVGIMLTIAAPALLFCVYRLAFTR